MPCQIDYIDDVSRILSRQIEYVLGVHCPLGRCFGEGVSAFLHFTVTNIVERVLTIHAESGFARIAQRALRVVTECKSIEISIESVHLYELRSGMDYAPTS